MKFKNKRFDVLVWDPERPYCWHRDDLHRIGNDCIEMNCALITKYNSTWVSSLHEEQEWFGYWQHDDCDYLEYTDTQLQQCVTERKISAIKHDGRTAWMHIIGPPMKMLITKFFPSPVPC